jgi:glucose-1-phosphate cytidylyltransferase
MKVVLFCGGLGLRLRDYADHIPKPMVPVGYRPILWHVMKYYAHFGHRDFVLCLGYRGDLIKQYFLTYNECLSNDFVFSQGGKDLKLANSDIHDWNITFADTGINANVGQRLRAVEKYVSGEDLFLANYCDGLTDLNLTTYLEYARKQNTVATFASVRPSLSYHVVRTAASGLVTDIKELTSADIRINGGLFVFRREIFKYLNPGEELVMQPFQRLIQEKQLAAYEYDGYFAAMDTFKDKQQLDDQYERGNAPWEVWKKANAESAKVRNPGEEAATGRASRAPLNDRHA